MSRVQHSIVEGTSLPHRSPVRFTHEVALPNLARPLHATPARPASETRAKGRRPMGNWSNPWKLTSVAMALVIVTALITGVVVAKFTGTEPERPVVGTEPE